jgi:putative AlgH/UPF0301 family transcriptional regulator
MNVDKSTGEMTVPGGREAWKTIDKVANLNREDKVEKKGFVNGYCRWGMGSLKMERKANDVI